MGERRERDQKKAPRANPASTDTDAEALRRRVEELETENDRLRRENEILREKVEVLNREAHRQAAPFRRPEQKRTTAPKRPGRPKGHVGSHRPRPARVDETIEAPLSQCACCGGAVTDVEPIEQFIEDIPEVRPRVTRIVTYTGRCSRCGVTASTHPRQMSHAVGAAGTQVGPRTLALAVDLNKRLGVPFRKTCDVLQEHLGIRVTPGALVQAEARLADRVRVRYENLRMQLRRSRSVYSDETSWYVGAPNHWLWVFTSNDTTLYVVDKRRGTDVVLEVDRRQLFLQVVLPHLRMLPDRPARLLPGELACEASAGLQEDAAILLVALLTVSTRSPRKRANAPGQPRRVPRARTARFRRLPRRQDW
jgi:hypothetical protein